MAKRINIICEYSSIYGGNFIPSILNLCEKLQYELIVFSFPLESKNRNWIKVIESKGYKVCYYDKKAFKKDISTINKSNNIDVIYTHFISGLKIKTVVPFNRRIKLFIHIHSDFTGNKQLSFKQKVKKFVETRFIRRDATYIFVSNPLFLKDKSKHKYFVRNALCLNRILAEQIDKADFLKEHHINQEDTVFLLFGWSPYIKGVDLAVKAFLNLPEHIQSKIKFIIVHGRDDGYKKCVDYLIKEIGNDSFLSNKNIIFVPPTEDVFSLYELSDIYLMTSRSEGFSYSLMEALYFNLNCIVNDIEGCAWAKKIGNCSFFKTNDINELSKLMERSVGTKCKHEHNNKIVAEYNIDDWSNKIREILER